MVWGTAVLALVALGSCFQQRFRNTFQGFTFVYIDRLRTLLLCSRFLGVRTFLTVLLSLIRLVITIIITLPVIVLFVFVLVIVVMVLFLQASFIGAADVFEQ
jgi:hypothetical protein